MKRTLILTLAACALIAGTLAEARPGDRLRERIAARHGGGTAMPARADQTLAYGSDPLQQLDLYYPKDHTNEQSRPLVVFVHGGGWKRGDKGNATGQFKAPHYTGQGYVFASINYRLVPKATVEQQAADVALALKYLLAEYKKLGIDPSRVVIMGHSAGAHLVALVGTDEQYLKGAGLSFANIDGVLPIDGAAYDVPRQIADGGNFMNDTYVQAFGTDPARQRALSPTFRAQSPNAPAFLLIHVQRKDGIAQNIELEAALRKGGTQVERRDFPGTGLQGHAEINRSLGDPAYAATPVVDDWLKRVFGD